MSALFLVTGFEPFGEHVTNSSWDALTRLESAWPSSIVARRLPVDYVAAHVALRRELAALQPTAVLCTGLAKGDVFRVERRARRPAALAGEQGATEVFGRWPWDEMHAALSAAGVHSVDSDNAGQFVCESTYWSLLNWSPSNPEREQYRPDFAAFLHVPPESPEHPLSRIAQAVGSVIECRYRALLQAEDRKADN